MEVDTEGVRRRGEEARGEVGLHDNRRPARLEAVVVDLRVVGYQPEARARVALERLDVLLDACDSRVEQLSLHGGERRVDNEEERGRHRRAGAIRRRREVLDAAVRELRALHRVLAELGHRVEEREVSRRHFVREAANVALPRVSLVDPRHVRVDVSAA